MFYILLLTTLLLYAVYKFLIWNNQYFVIRNLPHNKPDIGFGNIRDALFLTKPLKTILQTTYTKFKGYKYCGFFSLRQPVILVRDLELIKNVMIKDFKYFNDNGFDANSDEYANKNLFSQKGDNWKIARSQLTPGLSGVKIKNMFSPAVVERFIDYLLHNSKIVEKDCVDIKELCQKFSVESVASSVFSLNVDEYSGGKSEFRDFGEQVFRSSGLKDDIRLMVMTTIPKLAQALGLKFVKTHVGDYFTSLIKNQIKYREEHNLHLPDFLDHLRETRVKSTEYDFTEIHMASHIMVFLTDGFETSSMAMSYILFEIASHPEVMKRIQQEIDGAYEKHNHKICFELIQELKYLEWTIFESLRMHPLLAFARKRCAAPYKFPAVIDDGKHVEFEIQPGTPIFIPSSAVMMDPEYFPEPEKFDPERFNDERKGSIPKGAYLVFGEGPRQCLGMRYAISHMKIGIAAILRHFDINVHEKTQVPLEEDPAATFFSRPVGGIWLKLNKRGNK